jgi:S1 RNA binding domain protein
MGVHTGSMELTVGAILDGKVKSLAKFGAFVTLPDNSVGMVHISEIAHAYVNDIHDYLTEGQDVKVMVIGLDGQKINLSIKRTLPVPEKQPFNRPRSNDRPASDRQPSDRQYADRQHFERKPYRQNQGGYSGQSFQQASQPKSFDDMVKQFMSESDDKMSSIKEYSEHRTRTRKR